MKVICDTECCNCHCPHFDLHEENEDCSSGCDGAPFQMYKPIWDIDIELKGVDQCLKNLQNE
jgi:hypothetical protein